MSLYKLEMEHLGLTGSDAKEPFRFAMDMEKVYSGANGSSAGRRAPFYARVTLPPMTVCHGQLSQSWALSGEVLTCLMRMEGEEEGGEEGEDVWSDDGSEEGSEVGSEVGDGGEGGQGEGCSAVTKSLYTYGLQDRVLYDFCPASGRLVVATRGEIRVLDFLVPVSDLCVSLSFFDLGLKVNNFFFQCMIPLYDSESFPPLTLLFNHLCIKILTCMYVYYSAIFKGITQMV